MFTDPCPLTQFESHLRSCLSRIRSHITPLAPGVPPSIDSIERALIDLDEAAVLAFLIRRARAGLPLADPPVRPAPQAERPKPKRR